MKNNFLCVVLVCSFLVFGSFGRLQVSANENNLVKSSTSSDSVLTTTSNKSSSSSTEQNKFYPLDKDVAFLNNSSTSSPTKSSTNSSTTSSTNSSVGNQSSANNSAIIPTQKSSSSVISLDYNSSSSISNIPSSLTSSSTSSSSFVSTSSVSTNNSSANSSTSTSTNSLSSSNSSYFGSSSSVNSSSSNSSNSYSSYSSSSVNQEWWLENNDGNSSKEANDKMNKSLRQKFDCDKEVTDITKCKGFTKDMDHKSIIAIIDSGIDPNAIAIINIDSKNAIYYRSNLEDETCSKVKSIVIFNYSKFYCKKNGIPNDVEGHGTMVTDAATKIFRNSLLASQITILPIAISSPIGDFLDWNIVGNAITSAANLGANIINMSIGIDLPLGYSIKTVNDAIQYAHSKGVKMVAASGNCGECYDDYGEESYPSNHPSVISVGASTKSYYGKKSTNTFYSSFGDNLFLSAPVDNGINLKCSRYYAKCNGKESINIDGTSFAAPQVAGSIALLDLYQKYMTIDNSKSQPKLLLNKTFVLGGEELLKNTATDLGTSGRDIATGYGLINLSKSVDQIDSRLVLNSPVQLIPNPTLPNASPFQSGLPQVSGTTSYQTLTIDSSIGYKSNNVSNPIAIGTTVFENGDINYPNKGSIGGGLPNSQTLISPKYEESTLGLPVSQVTSAKGILTRTGGL